MAPAAVPDTMRRAVGQIKDLHSDYHLNPRDKRLTRFADVCIVTRAQHPTEDVSSYKHRWEFDLT